MADPRRRMYGAPFGALQNDTPPIQFGDGGTAGPAPSGVNALASSPPQPIAAPFGGLQGAPLDYSAPPQFTIAPTGDPATPENTEGDGLALARWLGLLDTRLKVPTPYNPAPYDDTPAATQGAAPVDSIKALPEDGLSVHLVPLYRNVRGRLGSVESHGTVTRFGRV